MRHRHREYRTARRPGILAEVARAATLVASLAAGNASADEAIDRGAELYRNHCAACHDETLHQREGRRVESRDELYGWVAGWSRHLGLDWRDEDVEDVTSYLSRRLYAFSAR